MTSRNSNRGPAVTNPVRTSPSVLPTFADREMLPGIHQSAEWPRGAAVQPEAAPVHKGMRASPNLFLSRRPECRSSKVGGALFGWSEPRPLHRARRIRKQPERPSHKVLSIDRSLFANGPRCSRQSMRQSQSRAWSWARPP